MPRVESSLDGGVLTITLADEENRNALSAHLLAELVDILDEADVDPSVRVIVITNKGRVFCAGANLRERSSGEKPSRVVDPLDLFARFRTSTKPYVGKIAGHCVAGGMGLAAALDISIGLEDAKFGFTEVRIGVAPAMISVICLPKMRRADAASAFLRGNRFTGREAAEMGLIHAAVPADRLDAEVDAVVADLLLGGPDAMAANKKLLAQVPEMSVDDAFQWTKQLSGELFQGEEAREGMTAFLEKRPPSWATKE